MLKKISLLLVILLVYSCNSQAQKKSNSQTTAKESAYKVSKSEAEWKKILTPSEYNILREAGTERPFTSPLNDIKKPGTLVCAACFAPVYKNENKFDSGTGWPSYDQEIKGSLARDKDYKIGYARTELKCGTCGSHLGHQFSDGPSETTGERHCINGIALNFIPEGQPLPALRK